MAILLSLVILKLTLIDNDVVRHAIDRLHLVYHILQALRHDDLAHRLHPLPRQTARGVIQVVAGDGGAGHGGGRVSRYPQ